MILRLHGEALLRGIKRLTIGDRPRLEHAIAFEAKVIMQPARRVLLDHEGERPCPCLGHIRSRLGRDGEAALGGILDERRGAPPPVPFAREPLGEERATKIASRRPKLKMLARTSGHSYKDWCLEALSGAAPGADEPRFPNRSTFSTISS